MAEGISLDGMKRIGDAETEIGKLQKAEGFIVDDIKEIRDDIKLIFSKINRMEIRLAIVFVIISLAIKYLPKLPVG